MKIAEKIKERRLALGMTQKTLAGPHMTRNMLSEIEHGVAMPSTKTLFYLAEQLDVSAGYLLDDNMTLFEDRRNRYASQLQSLFSAHKYADCIALFDKVFDGECDSALAYMMAQACLCEAEICAIGGSVNTALALLDRLPAFIGKTDYDTAHLSARAELCHSMSSDPLTPHYALDTSAYLDATREACHLEVYHYLTDDMDYDYKTNVYRTHIEARKLMQEYRFIDAIADLNRILESRLTEQVSVLLIYRVYSDLENCYRERKDYENAYKCSEKKHTLLASFRA